MSIYTSRVNIHGRQYLTCETPLKHTAGYEVDCGHYKTTLTYKGDSREKSPHEETFLGNVFVHHKDVLVGEVGPSGGGAEGSTGQTPGKAGCLAGLHAATLVFHSPHHITSRGT